MDPIKSALMWLQWTRQGTVISFLHVSHTDVADTGLCCDTLPLYNAEFTTPPTRATPKPICPILLKNCAAISRCVFCKIHTRGHNTHDFL